MGNGDVGIGTTGPMPLGVQGTPDLDAALTSLIADWLLSFSDESFLDDVRYRESKPDGPSMERPYEPVVWQDPRIEQDLACDEWHCELPDFPGADLPTPGDRLRDLRGLAPWQGRYIPGDWTLDWDELE